MKHTPEEIEILLADESFQRWLSGTASPDEKKRWNLWLNESLEQRALYEEARQLWRSVAFRSAPPPDVEAEWRRLQERLQLSREKPGTIYNLQDYRKAPAKPLHRRSTGMSFGAVAMAAAILMAILLYSMHMQQQPTEPEVQVVATDYGQRARINLPDGTRIILNANSTLKCPAVWSEDKARYFELAGEAYFDVARRENGKEGRLVVATEDGRVEVLGTRFVVYERGEGTRVVVEQGRVKVSAGNSADAVQATLAASHLVFFRAMDRDLNPRKIEILPYVSWWHEVMVLKQTPVTEIVKRLEETYGVEIQFADKKLLQRTLSGSIENRNLRVITEAIGEVLRVPVKHEGDTIIFGKSAL